MLMTEYETTLVVRPDIGGDAIEATLDRVRDAVKNRGGKLLAINHWGKKKLAYPIMKHTRGIYVHTVYLGRDDLVNEVERNLRIADSVLRFLTVKLDGAVDPDSRQEQDYQAPQYDVESGEEQELEAEAAVEGEEAGEPGADAETAEASADEPDAEDEPSDESDEGEPADDESNETKAEE